MENFGTFNGLEKLNIAVFGTASLPIPPFAGYGGTQRGIYDFVKNMGSRGHTIHLFGPGDSDIDGLEGVTLHSFVDQSLWVPENNLSYGDKSLESKRHYRESLMKMRKIDSLEGIDIVNVRLDNVDVLGEVCNSFGKDRVVYGLHNIRNAERIEAIKNLEVSCVAHCRDHKEQYNSLPNISVITYGVDVNSYPFRKDILSNSLEDPSLEVLRELKSRGKDYLVNVGGIGKHKGQRTSIAIAREAGLPLIIAGTPQGRKSQKNFIYHEEEIIPLVDDNNVIYFGNANEQEKMELLKYSIGFLFPSGYEDVTWSEPFGRAPVEALSCGTPVIAYRKGSMKEVILHGHNGFLFDVQDEAVRQVSQLTDIDRAQVRATAENCFNSSRVAKEYEELFYKLVSRRKSLHINS